MNFHLRNDSLLISSPSATLTLRQGRRAYQPLPLGLFSTLYHFVLITTLGVLFVFLLCCCFLNLHCTNEEIETQNSKSRNIPRCLTRSGRAVIPSLSHLTQRHSVLASEREGVVP